MKKGLAILFFSLFFASCQVSVDRFEVVNSEGPYNCTATGVCDMRVLVLKDGQPLTGYTMTDAANYIFEYEIVGDNGYFFHYRSYLDDAILKGDVVVYPSGYLVFRHTFSESAQYQVMIHFYDFRYNGIWDILDLPITINPCYNSRDVCPNGECKPIGLLNYECLCARGYTHPAGDNKQCVTDLCVGQQCDGAGVCRVNAQGEAECDCYLGYTHRDIPFWSGAPTVEQKENPLSCVAVACDSDGVRTGEVRYLVKPLALSLQKEGTATTIDLEEIRLPEVVQGCASIDTDDRVQGNSFGKNSYTESMKTDRAQLAQVSYVDNSAHIPIIMLRPHLFTRYLLGEPKGVSLFEQFKGNTLLAERDRWVNEKEIDSCENYLYKKYFMYNMWLDVLAEASDDPYLITTFSATPGRVCDIDGDSHGDICSGATTEQPFQNQYGGRILYFGARHVESNTDHIDGFDSDKFSLSHARYVPNNLFVLTNNRKNGYWGPAQGSQYGRMIDFSWHRDMLALAKDPYWKETFGQEITNRHFEPYRVYREFLLELLVNTILFRDLGQTTFDTVAPGDDDAVVVAENLEKVVQLGGWLQKVIQQKTETGRWPGLIQYAIDHGTPVAEHMKVCYGAYPNHEEACATNNAYVRSVYPENVIIEAWDILTNAEKEKVVALLDKKIDTLSGVAQYGLQLANRLANGGSSDYADEIAGNYENLNRAILLLDEVKRADIPRQLEEKVDEVLSLAESINCLKPNDPKGPGDPLQMVCGWLPELFVESVKSDIEQQVLVSEEEATAVCGDPNAGIPEIVNLPEDTSAERVCDTLKSYQGKSLYDIMQIDYKECMHRIPAPTSEQGSFERLENYDDFVCKGDVGQVVDIKYTCSFVLDRKDDPNDTGRYGSYDVILKNVLKIDENTYDFRFVDVSGIPPDLCEDGLTDFAAKELFLKEYGILGMNQLPDLKANINLCKKTCDDPGVDCNAFNAHYCSSPVETVSYPDPEGDFPNRSFSCKGEGYRYYQFIEDVKNIECNGNTCMEIPTGSVDYQRLRYDYLDEISESPAFFRWLRLDAIGKHPFPRYDNYFEAAEPDLDGTITETEPKTYRRRYVYDNNQAGFMRYYDVNLEVSLTSSGRRSYFDESTILSGGKLDYRQDLTRFSKYLDHFEQYQQYDAALIQQKLLANGIHGSSGFSSRDNGKKVSYGDQRYGYYQFGNNEFNVHLGYAYGWGVDGIERFEEFNDFIQDGWPETPGIHDAANLARMLDGFYQKFSENGNDALLFSLAYDFCAREIYGGKFDALEDSFKKDVISLLGNFDEDSCDSDLRKKIKQEVCNNEDCNYNDPQVLKGIRDFMRNKLNYFLPSIDDITDTTSEGMLTAVNKLVLNPYLYGYFGAGAVIFGQPLNAKAADTATVSNNNSQKTANMRDVDEYDDSLWKENQTELLELVGYLQLNPNDNGIPTPKGSSVDGSNVKNFFNKMGKDSKNNIYHMHLYVAGKYLLYHDSGGSSIGKTAQYFQDKVLSTNGMTTYGNSDENYVWDGDRLDSTYDWYFSKRVAEYSLFGATLTLDAGIFVNYGAEMMVQLGDKDAVTKIKIKDQEISLPLGQYAQGRFTLEPYVDVSAFVEGSVSVNFLIASASGTLGIEVDILSASLPLRARYAVRMSDAENKKSPEGEDISCDFFETDCHEGKRLDWGKAWIVSPYIDMNASMSITLDILKHSEIYAQADLSVLGITLVDTGKMTLFEDLIPGQNHYEYTILEMPEQYRRIELEDIMQYVR
ncbi:MAG TPA: hypothetical protein PLV42_03285 [bacterium]|nr:hypothetical protein [bacterium]